MAVRGSPVVAGVAADKAGVPAEATANAITAV